jgi:hypothetical protein
LFVNERDRNHFSRTPLLDNFRVADYSPKAAATTVFAE